MQAVLKLLDSPRLPVQYPASRSHSDPFRLHRVMNSPASTSAFVVASVAPATGVVATSWWAHGHGKG